MIVCHRPPTICGVADELFNQLPVFKFVRVCNVNPAQASGQVSVRLEAAVRLPLRGGLVVLNIPHVPVSASKLRKAAGLKVAIAKIARGNSQPCRACLFIMKNHGQAVIGPAIPADDTRAQQFPDLGF